jgi:hypothetical protein
VIIVPGLFRRSKPDEEPVDVTPEEKPRRTGEYAAYVPASVRVPELQRLAIFDPASQDDDGADEDLAFLAELASQVDAKTARPRTATRETRALTQNEKMIDRKPEEMLEVFREFVTEVDTRSPVSQVIAIRDVEIDDLLEDLANTAAALRLRKAA